MTSKKTNEVNPCGEISLPMVGNPIPINPNIVIPSSAPVTMVSGIMPPISGTFMPESGPDFEKIGEDAVRQYDNLTTREIGELVHRMSGQLDVLSEQTMTRDGWQQFDKLVNIFEELTGHGEEDEQDDNA